MYNRSIRVGILLLLLLHVSFWFFSSDSFCGRRFSRDELLNVANKQRRDSSEFHDKLAKLYQTIIRIKKSEVAVDRLLSRYARKELGKNVTTIYCITPTYARLTQKADLTRLCQTLQHVWNFHWIVVEDSEHKTDLVSRLLKRCGVTYTHLAVRTSVHLRKKSEGPRWKVPRGMEQRNKGLEWVRRNFDPGRMEGVVYFADDDNTYDVEIFDRMRHTKSVSIWPVGLVGGLRWEGPICKNNKVVNFRVAYKPSRAVPVDMAGFAVNAKLVANNPRLIFNPWSPKIGQGESDFLEMITSRDKVETLGDLCNQVLVWHTRTSNVDLHREKMLGEKTFPDLEC
ncbi:galactosylgalactosylxylosylprotein 3-beta-glucuronosyltransferase 3-like isoform X2 [Dendronephthya gigantea]|uniref:galactosylgalactosylxylosylprotein 3-beta-glucuronosyltransferase 3-like isoform X2 n=1 Tax=Dendronephthya gigantea TaxID=151771 RepID=UPI00106D2097|nr:galactosylgalactosylxylosylprotein 3-beta-glucuronosyltransferase 3-like isoform X2 [Dendronephthya gigantea]